MERRLSIDTTELKDVSSRCIKQEPNWFTGDLKKYPEISKIEKYTSDSPIQQGDLIKPLLMDILEFGLPYAFAKFNGEDPVPYKCAQTKKPKKVIIVGAGIAGLSAAFELQRAGHKVEILEMQQRVGGRIKTFAQKEGFDKELYVDGGAMRLPSRPKDPNKIHYLTDFYNKKFNLPLVPFNNQDNDAFLKFYNDDPITVNEWKKHDEENFTKLWPRWNATIKIDRPDIHNIEKYYNETTGVVTNILKDRLSKATNWSEQATAWQNWINDWCQFGLDDFLRSTYESLLLKVKHAKPEELEPLKQLLPWTEAALNAYSVYNYTIELDQSMVFFLRESLGHWWTPNMHHIAGGMSRLPNAFLEKTQDDCGRVSDISPFITYNRSVRNVTYRSCKGSIHDRVIVTGTITSSGEHFSVEGDAIIITTPLHIIRQMRIEPEKETDTPEFPKEFQQAIENIWYGPSTKIMIQSKKRFWEDMNITGGFSKTNRPIGQLHYPTNTPENPIPGEKGILLCYTWKSEALLFGSLPHDLAIKEAVREIAEIHPEIKENYEMGAVQAWYSDPSTQGAYALLKPMQYNNVLFLMLLPWCNVYFAGEAISFASGWIQGALESSLRAAYQFYARNEEHN